MLDLVTAVSFTRVLGTGRTLPLQLEAERADGEVIDVAAKLSDGGCGPGGLVREAMAAMLAADLGLPVPEPVVVAFPVAFPEIVPDQSVGERIRGSLSPTFGTRYVNGLFAYPAMRPIPPRLVDVAAEIVAFDGACRNNDRWAEKPNCLTDGVARLVIIDHELALTDDPLLGSTLNPYPWVNGGMEALLNPARPHILLARVRGLDARIDRLFEAWDALPSSRFGEYARAIPPQWDPTGEIVRPIQRYLEQLQQNLTGLANEARRILK